MVLNPRPFIYADDATLFEVVEDPVVSTENLNDLASIFEWSDKWLVTMNPLKTHSTLFSLKKDKLDHPKLTVRGMNIQEVDSYSHLGLTFQNNMSWSKYVLEVCKKTSK